MSGADASGQPMSTKTRDFFNFLGTELVVIALDEAHVLQEEPQDPQNSDKRNWSMIVEIRRAFRSVITFHVFLVTMSTRGRLKLLSPDLKDVRSNRVAKQELCLFQPITETGFNQLALRIDAKPLLLRYIASALFVSHMGRPM